MSLKAFEPYQRPSIPLALGFLTPASFPASVVWPSYTSISLWVPIALYFPSTAPFPLSPW